MSIKKTNIIAIVVIGIIAFSAFATVATAMNWPPNVPPYDEVCVLVIGISGYENSSWNIDSSAVRDANYFYWMMLDNWPQCSQEIVVLTNSEATHDNIMDAFDDVFADADEDTLAIVHWGGHGGTDAGDGILLTHDMLLFTDDELGAEIDAITAGTKVVILDSCHMEEFSSELDLDDTIAILTTEYDESTHSYKYPPVLQRHKPFSYHFRRASDTNSDGVLTIEEAFIEAYPLTVADAAAHNDCQHPVIIDNVAGSVPFIDTYG